MSDDARVSISAEAWRAIDAMLADLPYRIAAPIVAVVQRTGGVADVEPPPQPEPKKVPHR